MNKKLKSIEETKKLDFYVDLFDTVNEIKNGESIYATDSQIKLLIAGIPRQYEKLKAFLQENIKSFSYFEIIEVIEKLTTNPNITNELSLEENSLLKALLGMINNTKAMAIFQKEMQFLKKHFSLDCNIDYVGAGYIPLLAEMISKNQTKGVVRVYDPDILPNSVLQKPNLLFENSKLQLYRKCLWNIPTDSDLMIFDDVCPSTPYFVDLLMNKGDQGAIFRLCDGRYSQYGHKGLLSREAFCNLMLDKYSDKGLEYHEKEKVLVKKR